MSVEETVAVRPPFDPDVAAALAVHGDALVTGMSPEELLGVRHRPPLEPDPTDADLARSGAYEVRTVHVPAADGQPTVELVVCRPAGGTTAVPVLYYVHGGGMVAGNARRDLPAALELAGHVDAAVVSVEYRLAPETPHPGPLEDCYRGLVWTQANAAALGLDPTAVVVTGVSAGGGLAAGVVLLARDRGGPRVRAQLLVSPMLDDRNDTVSSHQMLGVGVWDRTANATGWQALLGDAAGGPSVPAYAAPARAEDLTGMPPTFVDVGSADTFRDEDVAWVTRLWHAGADAELHVWAGGCHGFDGLAPRAAVSVDARRARARWLERVLGR